MRGRCPTGRIARVRQPRGGLPDLSRDHFVWSLPSAPIVLPLGLRSGPLSIHGSCPFRSDQRHTAGCPAFEVRITYPFHPRSGETVAVVGSKRHAGADHLVVRQPDRTLALLPAWMTKPEAASHQLVLRPRLPIDRLCDLRALVEALLASSRRESSRRKGAGREERTTQPKGSVRGQDDGFGVAARSASEAERAASGPPDGGDRQGTADRPGPSERQGGRR